MCHLMIIALNIYLHNSGLIGVTELQLVRVYSVAKSASVWLVDLLLNMVAIETNLCSKCSRMSLSSFVLIYRFCNSWNIWYDNFSDNFSRETLSDHVQIYDRSNRGYLCLPCPAIVYTTIYVECYFRCLLVVQSITSMLPMTFIGLAWPSPWDS